MIILQDVRPSLSRFYDPNGSGITLDKTEEVRRLGMGRLLDDISRKMQHKVEQKDKDPLKILVHSTHDTALAGLCSTLDVFDDK